MGKSTAKQTTTTIRIVNNNKEIKYFKLHNHMYALVDLVFVINRNWELQAPAIPHGFLGLEISISITLLETTDLVHADLILFTSIESLSIIHAISLHGRRNPPPLIFGRNQRAWYVDFPQTNARLNTRKMASATKPVQVFRNFLIGVS